jgi:hypothetical protein
MRYTPQNARSRPAAAAEASFVAAVPHSWRLSASMDSLVSALGRIGQLPGPYVWLRLVAFICARPNLSVAPAPIDVGVHRRGNFAARNRARQQADVGRRRK